MTVLTRFRHEFMVPRRESHSLPLDKLLEKCIWRSAVFPRFHIQCLDSFLQFFQRLSQTRLERFQFRCSGIRNV